MIFCQENSINIRLDMEYCRVLVAYAHWLLAMFQSRFSSMAWGGEQALMLANSAECVLMATGFLPMSCRSPFTVPITTLPAVENSYSFSPCIPLCRGGLLSAKFSDSIKHGDNIFRRHFCHDVAHLLKHKSAVRSKDFPA